MFTLVVAAIVAGQLVINVTPGLTESACNQALALGEQLMEAQGHRYDAWCARQPIESPPLAKPKERS